MNINTRNHEWGENFKYGALTPSLFPTVSNKGDYRKLNLKSVLANSWLSQETRENQELFSVWSEYVLNLSPSSNPRPPCALTVSPLSTLKRPLPSNKLSNSSAHWLVPCKSVPSAPASCPASVIWRIWCMNCIDRKCPSMLFRAHRRRQSLLKVKLAFDNYLTIVTE